MKRFIILLNSMGINLKAFFIFWKELPSVYKDYRKLKKQKGNNTDFFFGRSHIITKDKHASSGIMSGHYFHQDLLIARKIFLANPVKHVDIGSRTDGFVAHVAVFRKIEIFDIREQTGKIENVVYTRADLMKLPKEMENYCDSVSALHSIEHFGLGRYGDPVDYHGYIKAIDNITQMLKPSGMFYFSVPIGTQRIEFNAHRVFSLPFLWNILKKHYRLKSFSYVDDAGNLHENVEFTDVSIENSFHCEYGCGIFELQKETVDVKKL